MCQKYTHLIPPEIIMKSPTGVFMDSSATNIISVVLEVHSLSLNRHHKKQLKLILRKNYTFSMPKKRQSRMSHCFSCAGPTRQAKIKNKLNIFDSFERHTFWRPSKSGGHAFTKKLTKLQSFEVGSLFLCFTFTKNKL